MRTIHSKDDHIESALNDIKQLLSNDSLAKVNKNILELTNSASDSQETCGENSPDMCNSNRSSIKALEVGMKQDNATSSSSNNFHNCHGMSKENAAIMRLTFLENMVHDALRAELREWLNVHLAGIVREIIKQKIQEIMEQHTKTE